MKTPAKLVAFGAALAVALGGGWVLGATVGPQSEPDVADGGTTSDAMHGSGSGEDGGMPGHGAQGGDGGHGGHAEDGHGGGGHAAGVPAGLSASQDGYTFAPLTSTLRADRTERFRFRILGPDGHPVTRFEVEHEKKLHLILVRRDSAEFQHLHPAMAADGTWSVPLRLTKPGSYRAFADFRPTDGQAMTLGVDLAVPGTFQPETFAPSRVATVDGYQVRLDGELKPGETSDLTLTVTRGGKPVTDLQQYLGASGHLVALRQGDLAYLHVHPVDPETRGPEIRFQAEVPSPGTYRLYLDFQHRGTVRTAEFTVPAEGHHHG
ncbi:hypothetical protein [Thermocrispum agreste]|uniref:hypothetical protein n=1 Tax=Thermocrispum agreste TaxID=37925 RepID=UPI000424FF1C|nr:hypothetical protein [Thermocrispum agreste]